MQRRLCLKPKQDQNLKIEPTVATKEPKSSSSSLIRLLQSNSTSAQTSLRNGVTTSAAQTNSRQPQAQRPCDNELQLKPCPLCGRNIPIVLYDAHLSKESAQLAAQLDEEDDYYNEMPITNTNPPPLQQQPVVNKKRKQQEQSTGPQARLLVIGGKPVQSVPKNPKKLVKTAKPKKKMAVEMSYNHYKDGGGGFIDGETIGLAMQNAGMTWEGVGGTTCL